MKFNADDLLNQPFERRFRGYDKEQVREFLESLSRQMAATQREFVALQDEVAKQNAAIDTFQTRERSLLDALETAREVAQEIKRKAEDECVQRLADAETRADHIVKQAQRQRDAIQEQSNILAQNRERLEQDLRQVLGSHLMLLDNPSDKSKREEHDHEDTAPPVSKRVNDDAPTRRKPQSSMHGTMKITDNDIASSTLRIDSCNSPTLVGMGMDAPAAPQ